MSRPARPGPPASTTTRRTDAMDHDALGTHVTKLVAWKKEMETLAFEIRRFMSSVSADDDKAVLAHRVDGISSKIDGLSAKLDQIGSLQQGGLTVLHDMQNQFPPERVDAIVFMLTWFQDNREALDVLLSLGDDAPEPTAVETAASGNASGAAPDEEALPSSSEPPIAGPEEAVGAAAAIKGDNTAAKG